MLRFKHLTYAATLLTQFPDLHNSQHGSPLHIPHALPQPYYAIFFVWIFPLTFLSSKLYLPNFPKFFFPHSMVLVQLT